MKISPWVLLCLLPLLAGCKTELYSQLDESEANQMLALLLYNKIPATKEVDKSGVTVMVDQDSFVDAVEVLRQNGLPHHQTVTMQDLFPSGQLVTSPEQEAAKLSYLKGQQLEGMLSSMDGVISAQVSVASPQTSDVDASAQNSVAVFIKYSPRVNLPAHSEEIRDLVRNAIPGLDPSRISLAFQQAEYHFRPLQTDMSNIQEAQSQPDRASSGPDFSASFITTSFPQFISWARVKVTDISSSLRHLYEKAMVTRHIWTTPVLVSAAVLLPLMLTGFIIRRRRLKGKKYVASGTTSA